VTIAPDNGVSERTSPDAKHALSCGNALVGVLSGLIRDEEVAGSNPVTPTIETPGQEHKSALQARLF
jgi:hypothetical protein